MERSRSLQYNLSATGSDGRSVAPPPIPFTPITWSEDALSDRDLALSLSLPSGMMEVGKYTHSADPSYAFPSPLTKPFMSDESFEALPLYSDIESDSDLEELFARGRRAWIWGDGDEE